ncbi:hypothetical protein Tco_0037254 [Tanacetum coccineum]
MARKSKSEDESYSSEEEEEQVNDVVEEEDEEELEAVAKTVDSDDEIGDNEPMDVDEDEVCLVLWFN